MTICSHTIVKNGMPYIGEVLKRVLPFVDRMLITVSVWSADDTVKELIQLRSPKVELNWEDVTSPGQLTKERQKQVDKTETDWIWFLDDDDLYNPNDIPAIFEQMTDDCDALALNPYQLIDAENYDRLWWNKWFSKFFRNQDINYRGPWPNDWIYKGDQILYWKKNSRVKRISQKFYHLALLKKHSFRQQLTRFKYPNSVPIKLPEDNINWLRENDLP